MKSRRSSLLLLGLGLWSSCASYQISTIDVKADHTNLPANPFTFENDSVKITYNFKGYNAPLEISVWNKLSEPVYIDWGKSVLIFDDNSFSLTGDKISISGNLSGTIHNSYQGAKGYSQNTINQGINLSAFKPLSISFIAPKAIVKRKTIQVAGQMLENIPVKNMGYSYVNHHDGTMVTKVPTAKFNADDSPLKFKSYLTLYTSDRSDHIKNEMIYRKDFYVSEIKNTSTKPDKLSYYADKKSSVFYTGKITTFGKIASFTGEAVAEGVAQGIAEGLSDDHTRNKKSTHR